MIFVIVFTIFLFNSKFIHETDSEILGELFKRSNVEHPSATINKQDLKRAKENIEKHQWAKTIQRRILSRADETIKMYSEDSFLDNMIPRTSPVSQTFCPHCARDGKDFIPSGHWSWNQLDPDHIKCQTCGTVYPNENYPETLQYQSTWDPEQIFTYIDNGPRKCFDYYRCYSSVNGLIRNYKLQYTIKRLTTLSQAYSLSEDIKYAEATKRILLKLADRVSKYLVYCGHSYNQYADCDPRYAVQHIPNLPVIDGKKCPIIVADPESQSDTFHDDYGQTGRLGSTGSDGEFVEIMALAYDLIADAKDKDGTPLLTDEEKKHIEEDLLIDSCLLGYFHKVINNKSTLNIKGCTIVGLVVGNAKLVRFGLDNFDRTFDEYFLKDGSTSQSVTYGIKTLTGFGGFNLAFRNYSDPSYYTPGPNEIVYKNFNINKETEYESLWHALVWCLYYDTTYPIISDQTHGRDFPSEYYEFLTNEYKHQYIQEFIGSIQSKEKVPQNDALFLRDPDYVPFDGNFVLSDMIYPYWMQGYIRSGEYGEESLLFLDASSGDGGHHHYDSLNIIYTKYGKELLLDLGYLLDHPNKSKTMQTTAHNLVMIDGLDQKQKQRGGVFHIFETTLNDTKVMQASSLPYPNVDVYHRTLIQIEHENKKNYVVDIFRANGGSERRELVFHGPNHDYSFNKPLKFDTPHKVIPINGYVQFLVRSQVSFEIAEISMYEVKEDGTYGEELLLEIDEKLLATNISRYNCNSESFFCGRNNKDSPLTYSIVDGPEEGKKAIKVHCDSTTAKCNGYLLVGHENNLLHLNDNSRYVLQFKVKGDIFSQAIRLVMIEKNQTRLTENSLWEIKPDKWSLFKGYFDVGAPFSESLGTKTNDPITITWKIDDEMNFSTFIPARNNQQIFYKNSWGQRYRDNRDFGATLPYFFIDRDLNEPLSTWVTVYEGYNKSQGIVKGVEIIDNDKGNVVIKIDTIDGFDYVSSCFAEGSTVEGFGLKSDGKVSVLNNGKPRLFDGKVFEFNGKKIKVDNYQYSGNVIGNGNSENKEISWYDIEGDIDIKKIRKGQVLFVTGDDGIDRGYVIQSASDITKNGHRIFVKYDSRGFKTYPAQKWRIVQLSTDYADDDELSKNSSDEEKTTSSIEDDNNKIESNLISSIKDETSSFNYDDLITDSNSNSKTEDETDSTQDNNKKKLSKGVIAAIVIVIVVVIVAIILGVVFYIKKNRKEESSAVEL